MKCPSCAHLENKVIESRINQSGDITRRRRECLNCQNRFTTYEKLEIFLPEIIKKDGRREPFSREKIYSGIQKACQKRPVNSAQIEEMISAIEKNLSSTSLREISSRVIGEQVMSVLHQIDKVAYIRFASVYREFQDVEDFVADIRDLSLKPPVLESSFLISEDPVEVPSKESH